MVPQVQKAHAVTKGRIQNATVLRWIRERGKPRRHGVDVSGNGRTLIIAGCVLRSRRS